MRVHNVAGKKVKGKVTGITPFGAFVRLEDGRTGLVHISQVADVYVKDVHDFLSVGQEVEPTVLSADAKGKLAFSLKSGGSSQPIAFSVAPRPKDFEEMLTRFKTVSEDNLSQVKKRKNR